MALFYDPTMPEGTLIHHPMDTILKGLVEQVVHIPATIEVLSPLIEIVPLQLLAYYIAVRRGCDVDQPRNLAKSVTVE